MSPATIVDLCIGGTVQELEDVLRHGVRRTGRVHPWRGALSLDPGRQHQARPFETSTGSFDKTLMGFGGAIAAPVTAYQYDWNMLPIGQALWLKHLQTYVDFPPLQNPASYNLDQVMQQVREMKSNSLSD